MGKFASSLLALINNYKANATVILAIVSGLGMILTKNYSGGLSTIFQALAVVFGGTSVAGLTSAVARLGRPQVQGLRHAVADDPGDSNATAGSQSQ
jgi:hypothetical protein